MEIRCRKGNCVHNTGCSCRAKAVKICKTTAKCETFEHDSAKPAVTIEKGNMFRAAKKLPAKNTKNVPLTCDATDCLFNKQKSCVANGIHVVDDGATDAKLGASCATFVED
jgi:hypothetical protein